MDDDQISERARKIEASVFNWAIVYTRGLRPKPGSKVSSIASWDNPFFRRSYANKARNIAFNLGDTRNEGFIKAIVDKTVHMRDVANMPPRDVFPELWRPIEERILRRSLRVDDTSGIEGIAQCGKCKSWRTSYMSAQTRSADEPMTNFFTCHNCGKRWKT